MNEIKIILKESGSVADLYKDFNLYQGCFRNAQITVYVPKSLLYYATDITNTVKIGAILTMENGKKNTVNDYYLSYVKDEIYGGIEYAIYTRMLPKEFTVHSGTQTVVINVSVIDNTNALKPNVITVTTSQTVSLVVHESAYLENDESIEPSKIEVIEGEINSLAERTTINENKIEDFEANMQDSLEEIEAAATRAEQSEIAAKSAEEHASENANIAQTALRAAQEQAQAAFESAEDARAIANEIEENKEYLINVKTGSIAVPKAIADSTGSDIAEQFSELNSDIQGLREDFLNESHFRGYLSTNAEIQSLHGTPNDYAYSAQSGTVWIYQKNTGWTNSNKTVPDQTVPPSGTTPLMDGIASIGTLQTYARSDHRHPSDTSKANLSGAAFIGNISAPVINATSEVKENGVRVFSPNNPPPTGSQPSDDLPLMNGTASAGLSNEYSRCDHVHPSDGGKANTSGSYPDLSVGHAEIAETAIGSGSATRLDTKRYINGVGFDGTSDLMNYGVCFTSGSVAAKTVSINDFKLVVGARVFVRFSYANTTANPTLNVSGTGAKSIYFPTSTNATKNYIAAVKIFEFLFDGTYWNMISGDPLAAYPVGAVYISTSSTSPASLFGGTWTQISSGYYLKAVTSAAGNYYSAGLPNITGTSWGGMVHNTQDIAGNATGAFLGSTKSDLSVRSIGNGETYGYMRFNFDANKSNNIYGGSTTVTPLNYSVYMWRRTA